MTSIKIPHEQGLKGCLLVASNIILYDFLEYPPDVHHIGVIHRFVYFEQLVFGLRTPVTFQFYELGEIDFPGELLKNTTKTPPTLPCNLVLGKLLQLRGTLAC